MIKVGINGFGRIGRMVARLISECSDIELVAIHDVSPVETMAHLMKFDSIHGRFSGQVHASDSQLVINNHKVSFSSSRIIPSDFWQKTDVVLECSGLFKDKQGVEQHFRNGAPKVIISAVPSDSSVTMVVLGVNDEVLCRDLNLISNASCTTNNAAPMLKVLNRLAGIESCYITTVHSYTGDQNLQDSPHPDLRRARAAALSIVPTSTGAAKALTQIFPELSTRIGGCGIRVPVPDGSLTDLTCIVRKTVTLDDVNREFQRVSVGELQGILEFTDAPIVSRDILGNPHSCVFDSQLTSVIGKMVKVVGWYDNECGYSNRMLDLIRKTVCN